MTRLDPAGEADPSLLSTLSGLNRALDATRPRQPSQALPEDAVLDMRDAVGLAEPGLFQFDSLRELVE